ncbi:hypothetical protein SNEBB_002215 [Seison nebaliae]|nr:hypothetical protein SNEBB_002215 [Seison nebaliae]
MSSSKETCPLCQGKLDCEETVVVREKGAEGINRASIERGVDIKVEAGTSVHKTCRAIHINSTSIALSKKGHTDSAQSVKRSARVSLGPAYDSTTHCFFCETEVKKLDPKRSISYGDSYGFVKTDDFVHTILVHCKTRADEWAIAVEGRIAYFRGDLHASDCVYHKSCNVNFRTMLDIPKKFRPVDSTKRRKLGRPRDSDQVEAFEQVCAFLEENDEEQLTISDLAAKMGECLLSSSKSAATPYGNQYLKERILERYGDSIFVAEGKGVKNIVTFREKTTKILREYYNSPREDDEEAQKRAILQTAAKLIKSDIKATVTSLGDTYPTLGELKLVAALDHIPASLRFLLQHLFVGMDTSRKVAGIGQAVVQAVRPRAIIAPLQLGLAVQMHHMYRSRFLIDSLSTLGFSSSYAEVQRFELNAACSRAPDLLGSEIDMLDTSLLFAGDNVDHNIITLDGKGTFHGMGMIATITPGNQVSRIISRQKMADLKLVELTKIDIIDYRYAKHISRNIDFQPLTLSSACDRTVDILWEMSFRFHKSTPSWPGMMRLFYNKCEHPGKSSVLFLPMIDMNPGDKTCILSTLEYLCKLASKHNMPAVVTFDQPLYWKASEIVNAAPDDSLIRNVVLMLGSFHTFMNVLGAIGTLMDGSGLKDIMDTVYGENAVVHMMSGKAVQRAFRGHLLVDQCLTCQIVAKIMEDDPDFHEQVEELERLYTLMESGECTLESLSKSGCIRRIDKTVSNKKDELAAASKTGALWVNYQKMLGIARTLVAADRIGSWEMHLHAISACLPIFAAAGHPNYLKSARLYLQKMRALEDDNPEVYQKFQSGLHVTRRSNQYWAGLGTDLVIEQTLMRSLKSQGGLTRGSGMSEHQRAVWTMSATVSSAYNLAMEELTAKSYTTSEQHKELSTSRVNRDETDLQKTAAKLDSFTPFSEDKSLRNIITGVTANEDVNVHDLFTIGNDVVGKMDGHSVFTYSHKRSSKVKTLASNRAVTVADDRTIDPALLFQRFLVVSQTGDLRLEEVMKYELCPYPMSLFEATNILCKPDKPQLSEAIRNYAKSKSDIAVTETVPVTDHFVLDGGSLLHRVKWTEGATYISIADDYASFTVRHYAKATVVFDGYGVGPSIKDGTHQRRRRTNANKVNITETTKFVGKKEDFLSNEANKEAIIQLITERLRQRDCIVIQAEGDADVEIAKAAATMSSFKSTTLVGEDTDLLVLLLHHASPSSCTELYFRSDKGKSNVYNIKVLKQILGETVCNDLLFLHAFTGCDSTSRVFGIGKKSGFQKIIKNEKRIKDCSKAFCSPKQSQDVVESNGCRAMVALFNASQNDSLESIRYNMLCKKVARAKTFVTPERLPPTTSACNFHSLRTYYQVMEWMGCSDGMEPSEWGWRVEGEKLVPVMTDKRPAPEVLFRMIHCNCSGGCNTLKCTCRKHGLECTSACGHCQNGNCDNMTNDPVMEEDDEQD